MPQAHTVRLRYVDNFSLDAGLGSTATNVMRLNSIHDPDYSGLGHQPLGHDEWASFYDRYTVLSTKVVATFWSTSTSASTAIADVGIAARDSASPHSDPGVLIENGRCKFKSLNVADGGNNVKTVTYMWNRKNWFRDPQPFHAQSANFGASPTEAAYAHLFVASPTGVDISAIHCRVVIDYIVKLSEPKTLIQS